MCELCARFIHALSRSNFLLQLQPRHVPGNGCIDKLRAVRSRNLFGLVGSVGLRRLLRWFLPEWRVCKQLYGVRAGFGIFEHWRIIVDNLCQMLPRVVLTRRSWRMHELWSRHARFEPRCYELLSLCRRQLLCSWV